MSNARIGVSPEYREPEPPPRGWVYVNPKRLLRAARVEDLGARLLRIRRLIAQGKEPR